jgi:hypothetical protein
MILQLANFPDTSKATHKQSRFTPNWNLSLLKIKKNWGVDQMGLQIASHNELARSVNPV